jgi:putative membrane protein
MGGYPGYYGYYHDGWGWGGLVLGILLTAAFWGLLITAIVWVVRAFRGGGRTGGPLYQGPAAPFRPRGGSGPEAILAERFARGEIGEDEYRSRLDVLRGGAVNGQDRPTVV